MITDRSFANMFARTDGLFRTQATEVHTARWQGQDISKRPDMVSYELMNWNCNVGLDFLTQLYGGGHPDPAVGGTKWGWGDDKSLLEELGEIVKPNLPWADDHFLERVGGEPLNPGVQWANWPWASSADKHRKAETGAEPTFNHSYMERLWPKWAGMTPGGYLPLKLNGPRRYPGSPEYFMADDGNGTMTGPHAGIRWKYGDLQSLVELLAREPDTRQAWIPLFFPEDTGVGDGGRKPCTLGYQFIVREGAISIYYPLRSCDYVRHFRDDIYLAIRLLLWVIDRCTEINPAFWGDVVPGYYVMHATSLHVFANDYREMFR